LIGKVKGFEPVTSTHACMHVGAKSPCMNLFKCMYNSYGLTLTFGKWSCLKGDECEGKRGGTITFQLRSFGAHANVNKLSTNWCHWPLSLVVEST